MRSPTVSCEVESCDAPAAADDSDGNEETGSRRIRSIGRHILIGLLTIAPLGVTWFILDFLFAQLSRFGSPWIAALSRALGSTSPELAGLLLNEVLQSVAAVLFVLGFLGVLGWAAGRVIGQRVIGWFESLIGVVPFVDSIYRATKRFIAVAGSSEETPRRVVLIAFPSADMKTIGLVTQTMRDSATGETLAAVYIPTAPNPTSGYIEILPMADLIMTDWTFDQAMASIVTGGSNAPSTISYRNQELPSQPPRTGPVGEA